MAERRFFAHSSEGESRGNWHLLRAHLEQTGARAEAFLAGFGLGSYGRLAGVLHDLGKYSDAFQGQLAGDPKRVNHSTAGAKVAVERYGDLRGKILAFCIAGHHAGLANGSGGGAISSLETRLKVVFGSADLPGLDPVWEEEIRLPAELAAAPVMPASPDSIGFSAAFMTRMVFSALVDADFLDTEAYYAGLEGSEVVRGGHPELTELKRRLDTHLAGFAGKTGRVNDLRREVLTQASSSSDLMPGLFSLTVPTGGGKTLSSLAFALEHAIAHRLKR